MGWRVALLTLAFSNVFGAATPAPECATCHPAETKLHANTRMAHAMIPARESAFAQNLPDHPLRESGGGFAFIYRRFENGIQVTSFREAGRADGVIEWVLGAGAQGQTPIVKEGETRRESRVSYFPELHQYGITVGQSAGSSESAESGLGRKLKPREFEECIGCHTTATTGDAKATTPGVQCEHCHSGADQHARGNGKVFNPGKVDAPLQVKFCGTCHRVDPPVNDAELENLRFQPLRLMKSRCFASGKLACTTCHPAHQDARRNASDFYNQKCHSCHDTLRLHVDERRTGDCIGCHMPYVQLHPALNFTDHFIRIVKANDLPQSIIRKRG